MRAHSGPRRAIRAAGVGALAGCTAGCVSLQTSGPVTAVTQAQGGGYSQIQIWPTPPSQHEHPDELVTGFLQAARSGPANISIANAYLTAAAQQQWKTDQKSVIVVADGSQSAPTPPGALDTSTETVTADVVGLLDAHAQYSAQAGQQPFTFGLTKTGAGYRISSLPENFGVVLQQSQFESEYAVHDIFFANAQQNGKLIPDQVYLPGTDTDRATATKLTALVLAGVPARLGQSAATGVSGAKLESLDFEQDNAVQVTLAGKACSQPQADCNALALQLATTLAAFLSTTVSMVRVVDADDGASGQSLGLANVDSGYSYGLDRVVKADKAYVVSKAGQVEQIGLNAASTAAAPQPLQIGPAKSKFGLVTAQPSRHGSLALTSQDGTHLYIVSATAGTGEPHSVFTGSHIASLSWDGVGQLWFTAVLDGFTQVFRYADGNVEPVQVEGLDGEVGALAVAPDGSRVAVSYQSDNDAYSIAVGTAGQQSDGTWTVRFDSAATVADSWTQVLGFDWYNEDSLAVLGIPGAAASLRLFRLYADGSPVVDYAQQPVEANPVTDSVQVCWTEHGQPIAATKEGKVYQLSVEGQDAQVLAAGPAYSPSY